MDSFATAVSLALQHGVPLRVLCEKFAHTRFEPSGWTGNAEIGYAKSIMDYIFRWIQIRFLSGTQLDLFTGLSAAAAVPVLGTVSAHRPGSPAVPHRALRGPHRPPGRHRPRPRRQQRPQPTLDRGPAPRRPRHLPRRRRDAFHGRHGRQPQLRHLRRHHDPQRLLLPLHGVRQHLRLLLVKMRQPTCFVWVDA